MHLMGIRNSKATADVVVVVPGSESHSSNHGTSTVDASPLQLVVLPHVHSYFCDRRREVCTAVGAVREENRIRAVHPGCSRNLLKVRWYRSNIGFVPTHGTEIDSSCLESDFKEFSAAISFRLPATPCVAALPAKPHAADLAHFETAAETGHSTHLFEAALANTTGAWKLLQAEIEVTERLSDEYMLQTDDIGRYVLVAASCSSCGMQAMSRVLGPVEAAPPHIRELWITANRMNTSATDTIATLRATAVYFGGIPGDCTFTWMRVTADGERQEVKKGVSKNVMCSTGMKTDMDDDATTYVARKGEEGCCFKVTVEPVRHDGVAGAESTSKPTETF